MPVPPGEPRWPECPTRSLMQNEMRGAFRSVRIDRRQGSAAPSPRAPDRLPRARPRPSAGRTPNRALATGKWRSNRRIRRSHLKGALEPPGLARPEVAVRRSPCPSLARADTGTASCHRRGIRLSPGFRCSLTVAASHEQPAVPRLRSLPLAELDREVRRDLDPGQRCEHGGPGLLAPAPGPGPTVSSSIVNAALTTPRRSWTLPPRRRSQRENPGSQTPRQGPGRPSSSQAASSFTAVNRTRATGLLSGVSGALCQAQACGWPTCVEGARWNAPGALR